MTNHVIRPSTSSKTNITTSTTTTTLSTTSLTSSTATSITMASSVSFLSSSAISNQVNQTQTPNSQSLNLKEQQQMRLRQQPHLPTSLDKTLSSIQDDMASASSFPYCNDRSYVDTNCKNNNKNNNNNSNNNNSNRMINDCSGRRSPSVVGSHPSTSKLISSSVHPMTNIRGENCHDGENLRLLLFFYI